MISVRSDISGREGGIGGQFLLDSKRPGNQRGRFQIRLHSAGNQLGGGRNRGSRRDRELRDREARKTVGRVKRRVLIGAVAQRILQIVVHAEPGANHGALVAEGTPRHAGARLRQKLSIVHSEGRASDVWLSRDDPIRKRIGGCPAMGLVPPVGKFVPEAERQRQLRTQTNRIVDVPRAKPGAPAERRRRGIVQKSGHRALQERLQAGERRLAVLTERQVLVRPKPLEPGSEVELMTALRDGYAVLIREQIPGDMEIAPVVASGQAQLGRRIRCRAASHHQRANRDAPAGNQAGWPRECPAWVRR